MLSLLVLFYHVLVSLTAFVLKNNIVILFLMLEMCVFGVNNKENYVIKMIFLWKVLVAYFDGSTIIIGSFTY